MGWLFLLLLWKGKWNLEVFRHTGLWSLLILGREGGGSSLLYRAGAGTQSKLCVRHTQILLSVLLREGVVDALSQPLAKDLEMKPVPLNLYSNKEQRSSAGSRVLG